jgi:hypothetical protein
MILGIILKELSIMLNIKQEILGNNLKMHQEDGNKQWEKQPKNTGDKFKTLAIHSKMNTLM